MLELYQEVIIKVQHDSSLPSYCQYNANTSNYKLLLYRMTSYEMVELGSRKKESRVNKPSLFKRKLTWPAKKMMHSLPFKILLISFDILIYCGDVGLDGDNAVQWFTMRGCYRHDCLYTISYQ